MREYEGKGGKRIEEDKIVFLYYFPIKMEVQSLNITKPTTLSDW